MSTDREHFLQILAALPTPTPADAIVLFTGDHDARAPWAQFLFRAQHAPLILVTGGVDNPPYALHANEVRRWLIEQGVHPDRVIAEGDSTNTAESARAVCAIAKYHDWRRLLIATSAYHMPRVMLSLIRTLTVLERDTLVHCVPVVATAPWWGAVPGLETTRAELLDVEAAKIVEYQAAGDVASYAEGLAYLEGWEAAT